MKLVGPRAGRTVAVALALVTALPTLAMLAACTGSSSRLAPVTSRSVTPPSPGAVPSRSVPEVRLRRLVLTAELSEAPRPWHLIATIPFGEATEKLGLVTDVHRTPLPYLPRSFAIGPDGSLWILDVVKHRLAHYSRDGAFLGAVGGFKFDRFSPHPRDVTFSGDDLFVLEEFHLGSFLVSVDPSGSLARVRPNVGGREVGLLLLYPSTSGVSGLVMGEVKDADPRPRHFARFAPASGAGMALPGVPVEPGDWIDLEMAADNDLNVVFTTPERVAVQPIRVRAVSTFGAGGKDIEIVAGPTIESVTKGGAAILVRISPSRPADAARFGGGVWLLRIGVDGKPLVWERLPGPGISDEEQVRRIAAGPDGRLYLMVPTKRGELIYTM